MSEPPVDPRDLRVSDAEREHVVGLLQRAIGHGLITLDEFSARTDDALAAKTRSELNQVLLDLPGMVHREATDTMAPPPEPKLELRNTMAQLRRSGRWVVPRELVVRNQMGSCDLDFTDAEIAHPVVEIEFDVTGGAVTFLLPRNATVDTSGLRSAASSVVDKVSTGSRPGRVHFVLTGSIRAGSLRIKQPTYIRLGALVIRFPWKVSTERD